MKLDIGVKYQIKYLKLIFFLKGNSWAHQNTFSSEDCFRALDTIYRLLRITLSIEVEKVNKIKEWAATEMAKEIYQRQKIRNEDTMELE